MLLTKVRKNKFEIIVISIAFLISVIWSLYNLKNFDNNRVNFKGNWYNQLIYADIGHNWSKADDFRNKLQKGENFFEALPTYEKYFLPVIIVGSYYHLINEEIYENKPDGQKVIKVDNYKFGLLLYKLSFLLFNHFILQRSKKKLDPLYYRQ